MIKIANCTSLIGIKRTLLYQKEASGLFFYFQKNRFFYIFKSSFGEVKIGNQIWMTENLNVDKFRNGDPIVEAKGIFD